LPGFGDSQDTLERWRQFPGRERVDGERVALTFDDGPDPEGTPAVLDALDSLGLKATFFLVGEQVKSAPMLAREVVSRGHEVGLHGGTHVSQRDLPDWKVKDEMAYGLGTLEVATGRRPTRFRPPYGVFSEAGYEACQALKLEPVYWSAWGMDWETISAERIAGLVEGDLQAGAILVLHDSARYGHRPDVTPTVEALPLIASLASERGLELGPLPA
jgi:peptidoglycan/xylan/chitin deacetylase (PgdA/CDA1 family)